MSVRKGGKDNNALISFCIFAGALGLTCGVFGLVDSPGSNPKPSNKPAVRVTTASSSNILPVPVQTTEAASPTPSPTPLPTATEVYYANCDAVRAAGKAPLREGQPGYRSVLDRDHDGTACDK